MQPSTTHHVKCRRIIQGALCIIFLFFSSPAQQLIPFTLEDQFGRVYTERTWNQEILLFFASDYEGSPYNRVWAKAISDSLGPGRKSSVVFVGVSDLGSVPFFLKGYVRGRFPKDSSEWVLMDWEGILAEAYRLKSGACNILLFDRMRRLAARAAVTEFDPKEHHRMMELLHSLLESD